MRPSIRPSIRNKTFGRSSLGMSLIEVMIVSIIILAAIAGLYRYYASVSAAEDAHRDSQNAVAMTNAVLKAYGPMANFSNLSTQSLISDGLVPANMSSDGATSIRNSFGGTVSVQGMGAAALRSFQMTYTSIPSNQCSGFVSQVSRLVSFTSIKVGNTELLPAGGAAMDPVTMSTACSQASKNTVVLTYTRQSQGTGATLAQCVVPPTDHQTLSCGTGYTGAITQDRTWVCSSFYALPSTSGWVTTSNTCALICVTDPTSPQTQTGPIASAGLPGCQTGELGSIVYSRVSSCAGFTGSPTWGAWTQQSDNCASACVVPSPQSQTLSCATGMSGSDVQHKYATCPAVVAPYSAPIGSPTWGSWVDDGNTCACALPSPSTQTQWDPILRTQACGAGGTGLETFQMQQKRSASCPSSSTGYAWSAWTDTGVTQNLNTSACAPVCQPDPTVEWVNQSGPCTSGFSGSVTWQEKMTRTSVCQGTNPTPTNSSWVDTGVKQNNVSTCVADGCTIPAGTTRSWTVGSATCTGNIQAGNITSGALRFANDAAFDGSPAAGLASFQCQAGSLSTTPMPGATCSAMTCVIPSGTNFSWTVGTATCNYTTTSSTTVNDGTSQTWTDSTAPTTGSASFLCGFGSSAISSSPNAGATCSSASACTAQPAPQTRTVYCAAGQYGYTTQKNVYVNGGYPSCWQPGTWVNTGGPGCSACPGPSNSVTYSWVNGVAAACPANQVQSGGTDPNAATQSEQYTNTATSTYSCPAGTTSLPAPSMSNTSVKNGTTANYNSSNCSYTCALDLAIYQAYNPGPAAGYDGEANPAAYTETRNFYVGSAGPCPFTYQGSRSIYQPQTRQLYCPNGGYGMGPIFNPGVASGYPNPASNPAYYFTNGWVNSGPAIITNTCSCNGVPLSVGQIPIGPDGHNATPMLPVCRVF